MSKVKDYNSPFVEIILDDISQQEYKKVEKRMLLAARIDDAIKAKGWKKGDFAKMMKKNPSEISKWLSGTHNFTSDTLFDIEEALGVELINMNKSQKNEVVTYFIHVTSKATLPLPVFGPPSEIPKFKGQPCFA
jgi:ribosome-binding protein aMBF1 (putative translation factor)